MLGILKLFLKNMMFKKLVQTILVVFLIWFYLLADPSQNSILAATLTETASISQAKMSNPSKPLNLELQENFTIARDLGRIWFG